MVFFEFYLTMSAWVLQVYPHGSTDTLPFATMGSGSLAAMAMFESRFKEGMTVISFHILLSVHWGSGLLVLGNQPAGHNYALIMVCIILAFFSFPTSSFLLE